MAKTPIYKAFFVVDGKKQPIFFRTKDDQLGKIEKVSNPPKKDMDELSGQIMISKMYLNQPFVINGNKLKSACEICSNRYRCWSVARLNNKKNCLNWQVMSICKNCTHYETCYKVSKRQCSRMARNFTKDGLMPDNGFMLDRSISVPRVENFRINKSFDLAMKIRRKNRVITWLLKRIYKKDPMLYYNWKIPKRSGGTRQITSPCVELKSVQRSILEEVLYDIPMHDCAVGFRPNFSIADNAKAHSGADVVVSLDLKDFFPSITFPRVYGALLAIGFQKKIAGIITAICTHDGALPQGAPTSPMLSNIVAHRLDSKLNTYMGKKGFSYTRYADDITFSHTYKDGTSSVDGIIRVVRRIIEEENFEVNEDKTKIMRKGRRQWVTGLVANEKPNVIRWKYRQIRAAVHNASKYGVPSAAKLADVSSKKFREWVSGNLAFLNMVNPEKAQKLMEKWKGAR